MSARAALVALALALALGLAVAPAASARPIDDLQQGDARVQTIGWRLSSANARFCTRTAPGIGVLLGDARTFNDPAAAREVYGLTGDISVAAVGEGGPAARAEVDANQTVTAVAGEAVAAIPPARPGAWDRVLALQGRLEQAVARDGHVALTLGDGRTLDVAGAPACRVRFMLDDEKGYARATRDEVRIGRRYYEQTRDRPEVFAAIVAHEMAHAVLDHQSRIEASHRALEVVRATEEEADRLSVWLLANAGYDPQSAVRLMDSVLRARQFLTIDPGHGGWKTRARAITAEIAAMQAAPDMNWARHFRRQ